MASDLLLLCTLPLPHSGPVSSSVKWQQSSPVPTKSWCHTLSPEAWGVGAETPMRMQREEWACAHPTRGEEHGGGPRLRAVTDDPHCCSLSWDPWAANYTGSQHRWGLLTGTSGLLVAGQTESSLQYSTVEEPLRATPAVCALKCQLRTVFGRGQPLRWGARGGGAGLLGPGRRHT